MPIRWVERRGWGGGSGSDGLDGGVVSGVWGLGLWFLPCRLTGTTFYEIYLTVDQEQASHCAPDNEKAVLAFTDTKPTCQYLVDGHYHGGQGKDPYQPSRNIHGSILRISGKPSESRREVIAGRTGARSSTVAAQEANSLRVNLLSTPPDAGRLGSDPAVNGQVLPEVLPGPDSVRVFSGFSVPFASVFTGYRRSAAGP